MRKRVAMSRRAVLGGGLVALLPLPEQAIAGEKHSRRSDLLVLLLKGLYTPALTIGFPPARPQASSSLAR